MGDWAIYDDKGLIERGSEDDVRAAFEHPDFEWTGDLVLVEIREVKR